MDGKRMDVTQREAQLNHLDGWNVEPTTWMDET
jgi:hypothetical protein